MTAQAWVMLAVTWTVVSAFALRYFLAVLRTPLDPPGPDLPDTRPPGTTSPDGTEPRSPAARPRG